MEHINNIIVKEYCRANRDYDENRLDRFLHNFYKANTQGKLVKYEDRAQIWREVSEVLKNKFK